MIPLRALLAVFTFATSMISATPPNVLVVVIDDIPFLQQWSESAPIGTDLQGYSFDYESWPTPNIDAFRDDSVVFPKSYCGGPKCSPSRASLLTGRYPSRLQFSIDRTLDESDGVEGVDITVQTAKLLLNSADAEFNLPNVLQTNGYATGVVGKYHLLPLGDGCNELGSTINANLYPRCTEKIGTNFGFDFVNAFFVSNIGSSAEFSHNPEWMVSQTQRFVRQAKDDGQPFFLYFASTLTHTPDVYEALNFHTMDESPRGSLSAIGEYPDDTLMQSRSAIWDAAIANGGDLEARTTFATYYWVDDMFGAIVNFLKNESVYDDTLIVLQSDHGQFAKGLLYEQGSRILNFVKYPSSFGSDYVGAVMPKQFVVSNVDLASTIFEIADIDPPVGYVMDGTSWKSDVNAYLTGDDSEDGANNECCTMRFVDVFNSRALQTERFQYIFRANNVTETAFGVDELYADILDTQQLYDLDVDPSEQNNLFNDKTALRAYSDEVTQFQIAMRAYVADTCPVTDASLECIAPALSFCSSEVSESFSWSNIPNARPATKAYRLQLAKDSINAADASCFADDAEGEYAYKWLYSRQTQVLELDLIVCCGDDGPMFPGSFVIPDGYELDDGAAMGVVGDTGEVDALKFAFFVGGAVGLLLLIIVGGLLLRRRRRKAKSMVMKKVSTHIANAHSTDDVELAMTTSPETHEAIPEFSPSAVSPSPSDIL